MHARIYISQIYSENKGEDLLCARHIHGECAYGGKCVKFNGCEQSTGGLGAASWAASSHRQWAKLWRRQGQDTMGGASEPGA